MNKIPAVDKAVQMLTVLTERNYTQAELCERLGISMSTAYRILVTLQSHHWIRKQSGGIYTLAEGLLPLTRGLSSDLALFEKISLKLPAISVKHQVALKLTVRKEDEQLTYFRSEPPGAVSLAGAPGSTFPLIEGSVGAALLADESEKELARLVAGCDSDIAEKRDPSLLTDAIHEIRCCGSALNDRRNRWNIAALSVPVRDTSGRIIAALTVVGCKEDFAGANRSRWTSRLNSIIGE